MSKPQPIRAQSPTLALSGTNVSPSQRDQATPRTVPDAVGSLTVTNGGDRCGPWTGQQQQGRRQASSNAPTVSLQVCQQCQGGLLQVFHHCLSKGGALPSARQLVDEAFQSTSGDGGPPKFQPIIDPSLLQKEKFYLTDGERRHQESHTQHDLAKLQSRVRKATGAHPPSKLPEPKATNQDGDDSDSEEDEQALLERFRGGETNNIQLKQHTVALQGEIFRLRNELVEVKHTEVNDQRLIKKLQQALQKSLEYCMRAKEWQDQESKTLKSVVGDLKSEISSLMAYLLIGEQDKLLAAARVQAVNEERMQSEQTIAELERNIDEMKSKLHHAFKDYLAVNDKLERTTREASQGADLAHKKNLTLKKTLDHLTKEFTHTNTTRLHQEARIKDLEFELEKIVDQFNRLGEGKLSVDKENQRLSKTIEKWEGEFRKVRDLQVQTQEQKEQVEATLQASRLAAEATKLGLEAQLNSTVIQLAEMTDIKLQHESTIAKLSLEKVNHLAAIKQLTEFKDASEEKRVTMELTLRKEMHGKDTVIKELQTLLSTEKARTAKLTEVKEQLVFEVTDLKNNLEREQLNSASIYETSEAQKQKLQESVSLVEDKVQQLEGLRANLISEKKALSDSLRTVRAQLKEKEEELETFRANSDKQIKDLETAKRLVETHLDSEKNAHRSLQEAQRSLQAELAAMVKRNEQLNQSGTDLQRIVADLESKLAALNAQYEDVSFQRRILETHRNELHAENLRLTDDITKEQAQKIDLENQITAMRKENTSLVESKDKTIQEEMCRQATSRRYLMARLKHLIVQFKEQRDKLEKETKLKHVLQDQVAELRDQYQKEMIMRVEFEKVHLRVDRKKSEKEIEGLRSMNDRNRKLGTLDDKLREEFNRMNGFYVQVADAFEKSRLETAS